MLGRQAHGQIDLEGPCLPGNESLGAWEAFVRRIMRARPDRCAHESKVSVMVTGLERTVCEDCGAVSFTSRSELTGEVARDRFARPADDLEARPGVLEGFVRH